MKKDRESRPLLKAMAVLAVAAPLSAFWAVNGAAQDQSAERELMRARVGGSVGVESDVIVGVRRFEADNRTYWHTHEGGFILFVQEGRARVQTRGSLMEELGPGEIHYTPPGVEHWHGATPSEDLLQLGVVPLGGGIEFLEAVTDAQYNGDSL